MNKTSFRSVFRVCLALAVPAAGLSFAQNADANVRTTIPGASCYVDPFVARVLNGQPELTGSGGFRFYTEAPAEPNVSGGIVCPISRSLPLSTAGLSDLEVRFQGHHAGTGFAQCEIMSVRADGTVQLSKSKYMNIVGETSATLDFGSALNASINKGTYFLRCLLPLTTELVSVYHSEVDGVDGN